MSIHSNATTEMKNKAARIVAEMRELHGLTVKEDRGFTAEESSKWDKLNADFEALEYRRERHEKIGHFLDMPGNSGNSANAETWRTQDGREVRVYKPHESIASGCGAEQRVGFGAVLRALIAGPRTEAERRALSEGTASAGGYTVPAALSARFFDLVRSRSVCSTAGAQTVVMDTETLKLAKLTGDIPIGWRSENAAVATGDPAFGAVALQARSLAGLITLSRELVADSLNGEAMLETAAAGAVAAEVDRVCLVGSGSAPEPRGILNTSGIAQRYMGANGAAIANHGFLLDLRADLETANAAPTAYVVHPRTARAVAGLAATDGQYIEVPSWVLGSGPLADRDMKPARFLITTSLPITQTRGTATNASSVIAGDFRSLIIGLRESVHIEIVPGLGAANGQVSLIVHARVDCSVVRATDFAVMSGIIP
ncbi:MAG: phage major capsid protein [Gammaproteobacteria bacterium]|nr:phage major capsid protein [Gammaproteobacteria bacterium]